MIAALHVIGQFFLIVLIAEFIASALSWLVVVYLFRDQPPIATKQDLNALEERSMAKLSQLAGQLNASADHLKKIETEVRSLLDKIDQLTKAASDADVPADVQAALDNLNAKAQAVDDLVPDAPATAPEAPAAPATPATPAPEATAPATAPAQ